MDKRVVPGEVPKSNEEQERIEEAMRLYKVIDSIIAKGCDAEVKRIKGKLKVQTVRKSDAVILD